MDLIKQSKTCHIAGNARDIVLNTFDEFISS